MKSNNHFIERRKFPRYYPDKKNQPRVTFIFDNGEKISVEVINISRGGMLASTTEMEHFLEMDQQKIKIIEIIPPDRKPFRCAGNLLRLHPMREDNRCYCAIEFRKIGEEDIKKEHPRQGSNADTRSAEQADLEMQFKLNRTRASELGLTAKDLGEMLKGLINRGVQVKACGTCKIRCGVYKNKPYFQEVKEAKITELAEWVKEADKVITFG